MQWNEYAALAILVAWLLAIGASVKQGTVVVEPVRTRTMKDILQELVPATPDQVTGTILTLDGMQMILRRSDGSYILVEFLAAAHSPEFPPIGTGKSIIAIGKLDKHGVLHASTILRAVH